MITDKFATSTGPFKVLRGLSTEDKPTDVGNGSEFFEIDTGKLFYFDAEGATWEEQPGAGPSVDVQALSVTENGTYTAPDGVAYSPVTVDVSQGGGGVPESDVNFYDYDGTVVASYTAADFAGLSAMPENPDHTDEGLVAQGWNWTLADAQTYVAANGKLEIGQMYDTDDGATRIVIELHAPRLSPRLNFGVKGTATIDWGDNSTDTITGTATTTQQYKVHTYAAEGTYTIAISVSEGGAIWFNNSVVNATGAYNSGLNPTYCNCVKAVRISHAITYIYNYAFYNCYSLSSITIPNSVTGMWNGAFNSCFALSHVTIPNSFTTIGSQAFSSCYSLSSVSIPKSFSNYWETIFQYCYALSHVTIPNSFTTIKDNMFSSCYSLSSITIPNTVTSIGASAFYFCSSLASITIPSSVTSIGSGAFNYCTGLGSIKFEPTTPPTISSSGVFSNVPTDCVIYVPTGTLSAYTSATNYPSSSTYTYVEY